MKIIDSRNVCKQNATISKDLGDSCLVEERLVDAEGLSDVPKLTEP